MLTFNSRIIRLLLHAVLWIFIFFYPFIFDYLSIYDSQTFLRIFLLTLFQFVFFYLNSLVLIPRLLAQKKILAYIFSVLLIIAVMVCLSLVVHYFLNPDYHKNNRVFYHSLYNAVLLSLLVWGISSGLKITSEWFINERMKREIENEKIASELTNLKSQINPHFLFNSLNSIYSLSNKNPDKSAAQAIVKLSEMMRYMLYDSIDSIVPLQKEMEYLENYIALQRLRIKEGIPISFITTGEIHHWQIAPLLLIPFVENAFKYGISYKNHSYISIELKVEGNTLYFNTQNCLHHAARIKKKASGIGLANVRRRLELLYPKKYELNVITSDKLFKVELIIRMNND